MDVSGFRLERELGRGGEAVVYDAIQLSLGRRVALKLVDGSTGARQLEWPEHPRVVSLYATGVWEGRRFVAMQLVRGPSLAEVRVRGDLPPARCLDLLDDVASALDAAHRAGIAHGAVAARNVLVDADGRALLSDFGLSADEPSVAGDRIDFADLVSDCVGGLPPLPESGWPGAGELVRLARAELPAPAEGAGAARWRRAVATAAVAGAVVAAAVVALAGGDGDRVPGVESGARVLGSALAGGEISSVDCTGRSPSGGSQACTVLQTRLPGRRLDPAAPGVIRRWAVRGARGEMALQVVRPRGDRYVSVARSGYHRVPDEGVHVLPANLAVRAGDRIGVQLAPGAAIGVRRGVAGATTARWLGQFSLEARSVDMGAGSGFDHEILLRAEYEPGATATPAGAVSGRSARRAPAGRELTSRTIDVSGGVRRVSVVKVGDAIALDLFAGTRRLARIPVPDADPAGRLLNFSTFGVRHPVLRWRNPDGRTVIHGYALDARTLTPSS